MLKARGLLMAGIVLIVSFESSAQILRSRRAQTQTVPQPQQYPSIPIPQAQPQTQVGESNIQQTSAFSNCLPAVLNTTHTTALTLKDLSKITFLTEESDAQHPFIQQLMLDRKPPGGCMQVQANKFGQKLGWRIINQDRKAAEANKKIVEQTYTSAEIRNKLSTEEINSIVAEIITTLDNQGGFQRGAQNKLEDFTILASNVSVRLFTEAILKKQLKTSLADFSPKAQLDVFNYALRDFYECLKNGCTDPKVCSDRFGVTGPARIARVIVNHNMQKNLEDQIKKTKEIPEEKKTSIIRLTDEAYKKCVVDQYFGVADRLTETQKTARVTACGYVAGIEMVLPIVEASIPDWTKKVDKDPILKATQKDLDNCLVTAKIYKGSASVDIVFLESLSQEQFQVALEGCTKDISKNVTKAIAAKGLESLMNFDKKKVPISKPNL